MSFLANKIKREMVWEGADEGGYSLKLCGTLRRL
jgi:hypothetical protein